VEKGKECLLSPGKVARNLAQQSYGRGGGPFFSKRERGLISSPRREREENAETVLTDRGKEDGLRSKALRTPGERGDDFGRRPTRTSKRTEKGGEKRDRLLLRPGESHLIELSTELFGEKKKDRCLSPSGKRVDRTGGK